MNEPNTMHELIEQAVKNVDPSLPEAKRKKLKEVLTDVFEKGVSMRQALGVTDLLLENLYQQAYQFYKMGKYEQAMNLFFILYFFEGKDARFSLGIAACCHMQKNFNKAIQYYMVNAMVDPDSPFPFYHIADCFLQMGNKLSALTALKMMIGRIEENPKKEFSLAKERAQRMIETLMKDLNIPSKETVSAVKKNEEKL